MGHKGKELSNDVKKVVWSLLERGDSVRKVLYKRYWEFLL